MRTKGAKGVKPAKQHRITFRCSDELYAALQQAAQEVKWTGSLDLYVRSALKKLLDA